MAYNCAIRRVEWPTPSILFIHKRKLHDAINYLTVFHHLFRLCLLFSRTSFTMVVKTEFKAAWAIVLTSTNNYVKGVVALAEALRHVQSQYPLLVLYTEAVSDKALKLLELANCTLRRIEPIKPRAKIDYFAERFVDTWTKLGVWGQTDYDRLVLLDADMLPFQNMDELMTMKLESKYWVAACHACTCNPQGIKAYPSDWVPANCAYTHIQASIPIKPTRHYFNSGLIVLTPSLGLFEDMLSQLHSTLDLSIYPFPDQDFLNQVFSGRWITLPYTYNALKTLPQAHPSLWHSSDLKNVHYILAKPWDADRDSLKDEDKIYYPLYQVWWNAYERATQRLSLTKALVAF
ncbi:nucleotide-diphospho-sugar transferase [Phycomyces nitens]|nr:nucleotide-diphospho-sugar transferase [Phycomyces nitens]